jgi:hypothetical protein
MTWLLHLLRSVANGRATDRSLVTLMNSPAVALLQRFLRVLAALIQLAGGPPPKNRATAQQRTIYCRLSIAWLLHATLQQRATAQQGTGLCA